MIVADQSEAIDFLGDAANWPGDMSAAGPVQRIDTHGSVVFLLGRRVLKMKRAVLFDYMDFSTLERRERFCAAEVALNRRTAPGLYRRAVPLTRVPDGGLGLGGDGPVVEWLVEMARFDEATLFDRLAARGELTLDLAERLADGIAAFHAAAEVRRDGGGPDSLAAVIASNQVQFDRYAGSVLDAAKVAALTRRQRAALARHGDLIAARRAAGFVRYCHGDLHLRNICLVDGAPTLFDCIEFNEAFAVIDVLYDLAFLLMDLLHRGLGPLANAVQNRYLAEEADVAAEGNLAGLALLPLYLSLRAAIRSHVAATAAETQPTPAAAETQRGEAEAYLDLALACLDPGPVRLIAVGGLSGSGKSTLARALAPDIGAMPGALVLRSDVIRKRLMGVAPTVRLGPEAYGEAVTERVYDEILHRAAEALDAGRAVIADAVYGRPAQREAIASLARRHGVPFDGLWLDAPPPVMAGRIEARRNDASDATTDVLARQLGYDLGKIDWTRLAAEGGPDTVAAAARRYLATR